ncbi:hypothetical protein Tco_0793668 [Tanacetum coccineum]
MDWLSKMKFVIVCHEKVVRIPLEGEEILQVHGERTYGVTRVSYDLVIFRGEHRATKSYVKEEHEVHLKLVLELLRNEKLYAKVTYLRFIANFSKIVKPLTSLIKRNRKYEWGAEQEESSVKDNILATPSETSKVENAPAEMLHDLDQQMEKRADDGKENVVTDALSRKERVKPRRVQVMAMTIQYGVLLVGSVMDEAHASSKEWNFGDDQLRLRWMIYPVVLADAVEVCIDFGGSYHSSIQCAPFEALNGRKCRSLVLWVEIGESSLTELELVQETIDKVRKVISSRIPIVKLNLEQFDYQSIERDRIILIDFMVDDGDFILVHIL